MNRSCFLSHVNRMPVHRELWKDNYVYKEWLIYKTSQILQQKNSFCNVMCPTKYHSTKRMEQELAKQNTLCRIDKKKRQ